MSVQTHHSQKIIQTLEYSYWRGIYRNAAQAAQIWGSEKEEIKTFDINIKPHSYIVFQSK